MKLITTFRRLLPALAAGTALALVAGCPSQSSQKQSAAPPPIAQNAGLHGAVFGGRQPISGSVVVAYKAGSPPIQIGSAFTDSNGQFSMTFSPTPAVGEVVYLTSSDGDSGAGFPNPVIGLMTVVGAYCTSGTSDCSFPSFVNIDELTTVAAVAALKNYTSFADCSVIIGNTQPDQCLLVSNNAGLAGMARSVGNLVNVTTGRASDFLVTASQSAGAPLRATREKLDTLASVLAACVNGSGPGAASCIGLFQPMIGYPAKTLGAAWEIAAWPGMTSRAGALYALIPPSPVYSPVLATAPAGISAEFWNLGGDRYAFSANSGTSTISAWRLAARNGFLLDEVSGSPFATGGSPISVAVDSHDRYVYVANTYTDNVSAFTIRPDGGLNAVAGSPFATGSNPDTVAVDPSGQYVYVANDNGVSAFLIGAGGVLTAIAGSPFAAGSNPESVAVDPSGRYVYVTNFSGDNVSAYRIGVGGVLTDVAGSSCGSGLPSNCFATGFSPASVAVDPSGQYVYVANEVSNNVSAFIIGSGGALTPVAGSSCGSGAPSNCFAAGGPPVSVAMDPTGQYVYLANEGDDVSGYIIGAGGALIPMVAGACGSIPDPGNCFAAGDAASVAVDPSGRFVYVANVTQNNASAYTIGADGALTPVAGSSCGSGLPSNCFATGAAPQSVTVDPTGRYVYVADTSDNTVSTFAIGTDGAFTPITGSPFNAGSGSYSVAVDPEARYVFAANHGDGNVSAFVIGDGGKLAEAAGSPFTAGTGPTSVVEDPGGHYVYVANNLGGGVSAYAIGADGALSEIAGSPFAAGANPAAIAITPDGSRLYVANYGGSVSAFTIGAGGVLDAVAGSPFAAGIGPFSVAVSLDGQYVYVANSGGADVSAYVIGAGGVLTDVSGNSCGNGRPSNCFAAGANPRSLAVDSFGDVYVANYDDDNISVFGVDAGGALTLLGNYAAGDGPQSVTVTPDYHVYVTNALSNDISAYGTSFIPGLLYPLAGSPFPAGGTTPVAIVTGP